MSFQEIHEGKGLLRLVWYLGKKIEPNYKLLNNAIKQTQGKDMKIGPDNLNQFMVEQLQRVDFNAVRKDVERFLEDKRELMLLDFRMLKGLIESS